MSLYPVENPFSIFLNQKGTALNGGTIYIGQPTQDPQTFPKSVYWDSEGTDLAAQPLRTIGGYIWNAGTPAEPYVDGFYSIRVLDRYGVPVFYEPEVSTPIARLLAELAASGGSALIGFIQAGANAIARTVQDKLREHVSVFDYMTPVEIAAVQAGTVLDVTTAIQNAIDATPARGRMLFFPSGDYYYTSLNTTGKVVQFIGEANDFQEGTRLIATNATGNCITVGGGFSMSKMALSSSVVRTSGAYVKQTAGANRQCFTDLWVDKHYIGFDLDGGSEIEFRTVRMQSPTARSVSPGGGHVRLGYTNYTGSVSFDNTCYFRGQDPISGIIPDENQPTFGIQMRFVDVVNLGAMTLIYSGYSLLIDPADGQTASLVFSEGVTYDSANDGVRIIPSGTGAVIRCGFTNGWMGANTGNGATVSSAGGTVDGIKFSGNFMISNGSCGINADPTAPYSGKVKNIDIVGNDMAANVLAGARFDNAVTACLRNNHLGATAGAPANGSPVVIGTATVEASGNTGFVLSTRGSVTMASGTSASVINHGLARAPAAGDISITMNNASVNSFYVDAASITSTQFTIRSSANVPADTGISWQASKLAL